MNLKLAFLLLIALSQCKARQSGLASESSAEPRPHSYDWQHPFLLEETMGDGKSRGVGMLELEILRKARDYGKIKSYVEEPDRPTADPRLPEHAGSLMEQTRRQRQRKLAVTRTLCFIDVCV